MMPSGTITFHLVAPDPEFVYKLTIPFAYPVPPSVPDEEQVAAGVPGTGPYMLEAPMTDEGLTLVRNPYFRVWSQAARPDGYVDRIEWTFGVEPEAQVEAVAAGEADLAFDPADVRSGSRTSSCGSRRRSTPLRKPCTFFAVLDTRVPPFDDVDVRRAMNLAIDRDRIVQIFGGEAAAQQRASNSRRTSPGTSPTARTRSNPGPEGEGSWSAPDMEKAQRLVRRSGTAGSRVVVKLPPSSLSRLLGPRGDYMIELLDELGYVGSVEQVDDLITSTHRNLEFHMAFDAWGIGLSGRLELHHQLVHVRRTRITLRRGSATHGSMP